jgi:hypothetical protein
MATFSKAFSEARKKFKNNPTDGNYTFTWNGKSYNILQEGETKAQVFKKFGDSGGDKSTPSKSEPPKSSPRPRARPESKADSGGTGGPRRGSNKPKDPPKESSGGRVRYNNKPTNTTKGDGDPLGSGTEVSRRPVAAPEKSPRPRARPERGSSKSEDSSSGRLMKDPSLRRNLQAIKDWLQTPLERKAKGGLIGASVPPGQKGTPKYK